MDTVVRRFAARLHNLRTERNLTQAALAQRAKLDTSYISALERSAKVPSLTTLEQLANGLGVDLGSLVDFPSSARSKDDKVKDEIALLCRRLKQCDLPEVRRLRKAIEVLTNR